MYQLGLFYRDNGKDYKAKALFNEIVSTTAGDEAALSTYELAEYARSEGNFVEAIKLYGNIFNIYRYTELYPQSLYGNSDCYYRNGNNDSAVKFLTRLIELYPTSEWTTKAKVLLAKIQQ
jgi:TolA-binding protein